MKVTDEMVDRFLSWKLPEDFHPDAGISFNPEFNVEYNAKLGIPPARHQPIGTNLLTADQARAMLEHVLSTPSETEETLDGLMKQRLPGIQHEAREYIRRMRTLPDGEIDEQKMRFAEAALAVPVKKPRATASPYDVGGNQTKDYPGE